MTQQHIIAIHVLSYSLATRVYTVTHVLHKAWPQSYNSSFSHLCSCATFLQPSFLFAISSPLLFDIASYTVAMYVAMYTCDDTVYIASYLCKIVQN